MFNQRASNLFVACGRTSDFGLFAGRTLKKNPVYLTAYIFFVVFVMYTRLEMWPRAGWPRVGDPWFNSLKPSGYFMYHEV
jgi:hypothetical protein